METVDTFGEELPAPCRSAPSEAWALFEPLLRNHGKSGAITERVTQVLRFGVHFFGSNLASLVPSVLETLTISFEQSGFSSCMWIAGKIVQRFGNSKEVAILGSIRITYERMSVKSAQLLQTIDPRVLPDGKVAFFAVSLIYDLSVVEDYVQLSRAMADFSPEIFYSASGLNTAVSMCIVGLKMIHTDIIFASLDLLDIVFRPVKSPKGPDSGQNAYVDAAFSTFGFQVLGNLLDGLIGNLPEETLSTVIAIFRCAAERWSTEFVNWLPNLMQGLNGYSCTEEIRLKFMNECIRWRSL